MPDAVEIMGSPFKEDADREASLVWSMVSAMARLDPLPPGQDEAVDARTASARDIVKISKRYLEKTYLKYVQETVYSNLAQAQLGGIPGTFNLIKSFLNIKLDPNTPGLEDGLVEGKITFCFKCF